MANNTVSFRQLAEFFIENCNKENIISSVFDYLGLDCSVRPFLKLDTFDELLKDFSSTYSVSTLSNIIDLIQQAKRLSHSKDKELLETVKNYLDEHLTDESTLESIANDLHVSYYYLLHFFKQHTGQSLNKYRTVKRLQKAISLLINTDKKITDIATLSGFNNISYFSETFVKHVGLTPTEFKVKYTDLIIHPFYTFDDILLAMKMDCLRFLDKNCATKKVNVDVCHVHKPSKEYGYFLHESAIIEFKGVLYASWYNCKDSELMGYTPIRERRSFDGGKTWSEPNTIAEDKGGKILFCPPIYGISDGKLYMMINQMVSADYMHSIDLYVLDESTDKFTKLWSRPIPFKLNTNSVKLPNGKLLLPGRIGELDGFPDVPAVMISDSGKMDGDWRVIKVADDKYLPDKSELIYPETTALFNDGLLYLFNRNDARGVPLVYVSKDFGETWSKVYSHDIPYVSSKIYSGQLSDGRYYLIANTDSHERTKLSLFVSEKTHLHFTTRIDLFDNNLNIARECHYPSATEFDGKLFIIATAGTGEGKEKVRGAVLFTLQINDL